MKFYLGVTDSDWYQFLRNETHADINFWQPGGGHQFGAITRGAPFLFKLKAPINAIGGLGFYAASAVQPIASAWEYFGRGNGCASYAEFRKVIAHYKAKTESQIASPMAIGCIILTDPIFFDEVDWIPTPPDWSRSIVQGKTYDDAQPIGAALWDAIRARLAKYRFYERTAGMPTAISLSSEDRYRETVSRVRLGQNSFRLLVANAYGRTCAITGEHTLPVLEAAHIKPYAESGPHLVSNGLLLRSDLHKLFDSGYLTVTADLRVEVSPRIKEDYDNGREYYAMHGRRLVSLPKSGEETPDRGFLDWHNQNIYKAG